MSRVVFIQLLYRFLYVVQIPTSRHLHSPHFRTSKIEKGPGFLLGPCLKLVGRAGFGPATNGLKACLSNCFI